MTTRFVQSGAHTYKLLVLRHLADVHRYSDSILKCLELSAWVDTLQDRQGVSLARDEFRERTASKDIQLEMPKQLTETKMQILTQYVNYGVTTRKNFLRHFFPETKSSSFKLTKGCTPSWSNAQEKFISIFLNMIRGKQPFIINKRLLKEPFLSNIAKEGSQMEILRRCFGEEPKDLGEEVVLSIVVPKFCKTVHDTATESISMKKNGLVIFPQPKERKISKYQAALKEKEKMVNVLTARIEKVTSGDSESAGKLKSLQVDQAHGLFADADDIPYRQDNKRDLRMYLENKCSAAFFKPSLNYTAQKRDGMQDTLLKASQSMPKFSQEFYYFWDVKVKPNFSISSVVIMDFDVQHRPISSPKDILRIQRDKKNLAKTKNKMM